MNNECGRRLFTCNRLEDISTIEPPLAKGLKVGVRIPASPNPLIQLTCRPHCINEWNKIPWSRQIWICQVSRSAQKSNGWRHQILPVRGIQIQDPCRFLHLRFLPNLDRFLQDWQKQFVIRIGAKFIPQDWEKTCLINDGQTWHSC